jgi:hypothetical protein
MAIRIIEAKRRHISARDFKIGDTGRIHNPGRAYHGEILLKAYHCFVSLSSPSHIWSGEINFDCEPVNIELTVDDALCCTVVDDALCCTAVTREEEP